MLRQCPTAGGGQLASIGGTAECRPRKPPLGRRSHASPMSVYLIITLYTPGSIFTVNIEKLQEFHTENIHHKEKSCT